MKPNYMQLPIAAILLVAAFSACAGPCNDPPAVSSSGFTIGAYDPATGSITSTSTTVSGGCTKTGGNTATYTVSAGQGLNFSGGSNRAKSGSNFINYSVTTDLGCSLVWNTVNVFTFSFAASGSQSKTYYGCVPAGQYVAALTYSDTVTMTTNNGGVISTSAFPVSITVAPKCILSTGPGTIAFGTYTAFAAVSSSNNTTFATTCNNLLPYSMALDATSGVVVGLNYSLAINTTSTGGSGTLNSNGTGAVQSFFINGVIAAGQAGTCASGSCSGTAARTLTITY